MKISKLNKDKKVPISFNKLQRIKHKMVYKSTTCSFYNTKQYNLDKFYKPLCQI
jgi:hypothetical protein